MNARTIGYWASTGLVAVAMLGGGFGKLTQAEPLVESMNHLGYPLYLMTILGTWYALAAVALLAPGLGRLKEWTYAGIVFAMTGAFASHVLAGDPVGQSAPTLVLTGLAVASYVLRPASRRLVDTAGTAT